MRVARKPVDPRGLLRLGLCLLGFVFAFAGAIPTAQAADIQCAACRAFLPNDALYCSHCGKPVVAPETVFCWRCGAMLAADASYCMQCGSRVCTDPAVPARAGAAAAVPATTPAPAPGVAPAAPPAPMTPATEPVASSAPLAPPAPVEPVVSPAPATSPERGASPGVRRRSKDLASFSKERMLVYPPRVIDSPTGTILPSMVLHLSAGGSFGLSDKEGNGGFLISFGLGGVGEAMVSSSRILHISGSKTNALAGFRVKLPVGLLGPRVSKQLALALNVAASNEIDYFASGDYAAPSDGGPVEHVESIDYTHRETTLGIAATWTQGKARLHAALHGTDLRTENISYWTQESAYHTGPNQRDTYTTVGLGFDYAANERTQLLAEVRTVPRIVLNASDGDLRVEQITVYATGLRFYPLPLFGLDATLAVDDEAVGLADLDIGFGLHLTFGPRKTVLAPIEEAKK
jgi:hypothetical protein